MPVFFRPQLKLKLNKRNPSKKNELVLIEIIFSLLTNDNAALCSSTNQWTKCLKTAVNSACVIVSLLAVTNISMVSFTIWRCGQTVWLYLLEKFSTIRVL